MDLILTEVCEYLNNYFWTKKLVGKFTITNGNINVAGIQDGQYFRVIGSTFNDGVHLYPSSKLKDEEFEGSVWLMAVPQTVISTALNIKEWQDKYSSPTSPAMSPFTSESFGPYSYSKNAADGTAGTNSWQSVFGSKLAQYKRMRGIP